VSRSVTRALEIVRSGALGTLQVVSSAFSFLLDHPIDPAD
jgi:hypothetical protein